MKKNTIIYIALVAASIACTPKTTVDTVKITTHSINDSTIDIEFIDTLIDVVRFSTYIDPNLILWNDIHVFEKQAGSCSIRYMLYNSGEIVPLKHKKLDMYYIADRDVIIQYQYEGEPIIVKQIKRNSFASIIPEYEINKLTLQKFNISSADKQGIWAEIEYGTPDTAPSYRFKVLITKNQIHIEVL